MRPHPLYATAFALGLALAACKPDPQSDLHCFTARGDATCEGIYGAERPYCTVIGCEGDNQDYGCVPERPAADECYSPCGGEQTFLEDASCLGVAEESTGSESASETGTSETTGPGPCMSNEECPSETPVCSETGECIACSDASDPDAACVGLDQETPVCDAASSTCVQCLPDNADACTGDTPLCDEGSSSCIGCSWHEECAEACRMKTGACIASNVFQAANISELQQAIDDIAALNPPEGVIYTQDAVTPGSVIVPSGVTVAILGAMDPPKPNWTGANGSPALTVQAGAEVYVQGIRIAQGTDLGILVDGGELWLDRSIVVNNDGGGLLVNGGGSALVRNVFLGGDVNDVAAVQVVDGTATIDFTTMGAGFGTATGLLCASGEGSTVRNSLMVSRSTDDVVQCPGVAVSTSALEMMLGDNVTLMEMNTNWFVDFAGGDFHLSGMQPAVIDTAAMWQPGDPLVDIDGAPRVQDNTAAGADLP